MKRFHRDILLFGVILVFVLILVELLLSRNIKTHIELKFEEIFNPKKKAEAVFLGNSHAAHGINPRYLDIKGYTFYNFAYNGASPYYFKKWYNKVFSVYYPKAEYIIYAVDWAMFDDTHSKRTFDTDIRLMPLEVFGDVLINDPELNKKDIILNRFHILFRRRQLQYLFFEKKSHDYVKLNEYFNGYVPHVSENAKMGQSPEKSEVNVSWRKDFIQLIKEIQSDSIKLIFVNIPDYKPSWNTEDLDERLNYLDSVARSYNIPYLKYNQELSSKMNYDSTYYNNWIHLNDKGAVEFSKMLSNDLKSIIK